MNRGKVLLILFTLLAAVSLAACAQAQGADDEPRILYFTTRTDGNEPAASMLAPARLRTALGAQAVGEWGDLLVLHAAQPAQAIIIDGAAVDQVNADDLASLYRQCVMLAFFNLYAPEVAQLVNDPSVSWDGWMDGSQSQPGDFYIMVRRTASGSMGDCSGAGPTGGAGQPGGLGKSRSQYSLSSEEDFEVFVGVLTVELAQAQP